MTVSLRCVFGVSFNSILFTCSILTHLLGIVLDGWAFHTLFADLAIGIQGSPPLSATAKICGKIAIAISSAALFTSLFYTSFLVPSGRAVDLRYKYYNAASLAAVGGGALVANLACFERCAAGTGEWGLVSLANTSFSTREEETCGCLLLPTGVSLACGLVGAIVYRLRAPKKKKKARGGVATPPLAIMVLCVVLLVLGIVCELLAVGVLSKCKPSYSPPSPSDRSMRTNNTHNTTYYDYHYH